MNRFFLNLIANQSEKFEVKCFLKRLIMLSAGLNKMC